MSSKSFQKKKDREKLVKKKILNRRMAIRAADKVEREKEKERRELQKVTNMIEGRTSRKMTDEEVVNKLEHNFAILEALQKEKELLDKAAREAEQINLNNVPLPSPERGGLSSSADVVFTPNPEPLKGE